MAGSDIDPEEAALRVRDWHPRLQALYRYWRSIHPAAGQPPERLPGRRDFDPMAVRDQLATLWLIDVVREPALRFRYRLTGTRIREATGREMTGLWLDEAHPEINATQGGFGRFTRVVTERQPSWRRGEPTLFLQHADFHEIENVFLPLAGDGETVDMIVCSSVFYRRDGSEA